MDDNSSFEQKLSKSFQGMGPDGQPATFGFAKGRWYANHCPDCGETNGAGVIDEKRTIEDANADPFSPLHQPCIWCGKGPMVMKFICDNTDVEHRREAAQRGEEPPEFSSGREGE